MRKKFVILLGILLLITLSIGISYASWIFGGIQKDFNTLGSKCFELTMINESEGITLEKVYPITDQEGLELTGYTFTIKNTCNTYATYEVNLEDILNEEVKPLPNEYIKVSINDGTPENLNKLEEKEPTIDNAESSYELTSGSLAPDSEVTYTVKLWLDEETPAIEEVMNATFESKVTIGAGYIEEEELVNEIQISYESTTESINNEQEDFIIRGTSEKYNLTEYSIDNSHWSRIESPSKEVEIPYTFTEEGIYNFYIKDEVGNISNVEIETSKLDQSAPNLEVNNELENWGTKDSIHIQATDKGIGISAYSISQVEGKYNWVEIDSTLEYETTIEINENGTYYVSLKDAYDQITTKSIVIDKIDDIAPVLSSITNSSNGEWAQSVTLSWDITEEESEISKVEWRLNDNETWSGFEENEWYGITRSNERDDTIYIRVTDNAGNVSNVSSAILKIDRTGPTTPSITNSKNNVWSSGNVAVSVTSSDSKSGIDHFEWYENGSWTTRSLTTNGNSASITYTAARNETIRFRAVDKAGNVSSEATTIVKIDLTNPTASISNVTSANTSITVTASGSDSGSGIKTYQYSRDNSTWYSSSSNSYTFTGLSMGTSYTIYVRVVDNAGNTSSTVSRSIQTTAPKIGEYLRSNPTTGLSSTMEGGLYRYQGTTANNYICFGTTSKSTCTGNTDAYMYRILGINSSNQLKIIKKEALNSTMSWGENTYRYLLWPDSTIYSNINGSAFLNNSTYMPSGWSSKIATIAWKHGDTDRVYNSAASQMYEMENGWTWTVSAKIGLMYTYDYKYGVAGGSNCYSSTASTCKSSWLHLSNNDSGAPSTSEWLMTFAGQFYNSTGSSRDGYRALRAQSNGGVGYTTLTSQSSIRPVFFLNNSVTRIGGTGTSSDPFIIN